jgi:peptidoglycan/LPS O-acetylase OafA/YrhL
MEMNDQLRRVLRTIGQGFVTGALLALYQQIQNPIAHLDMTWARAFAWALVTGGVAGVVSAGHNFVLDPSPVPSMAPAVAVVPPALDVAPPMDNVDVKG